MSRNPINHGQVSKIILSPNLIDCIVFWTKNPGNMLNKLDVIDELGYKYYFQFTLTPYDNSIEKGLCDKEQIINSFCKLSDKIGKERVLWRYDPIIINDRFDIAFHKDQFARFCSKLSNYTSQCTISFVDTYSKLKTDILREVRECEMIELSELISTIAKDFGIVVKACCENPLLSNFGVEQANCIDRRVIEKICGYHLDIKRDKNQRSSCGCFESVDIGAYNTCRNGCVYCYANYSDKSVNSNCKRHNPKGELLIGSIGEKDKIITRSVQSRKYEQINLF